MKASLTNALQVSDVLDGILKEFGPSEVWQSTFSISEEFLRRIFFIKQAGRFTRYTLLLDLKATNKTVKLWTFISQVVDQAYLSDNHSKLMLVRSGQGRTAVVFTSQNLTRGNRYESYYVSYEPDVFYMILSQFEDIAANHSVPLNEIISRNA